MKKRWIFWIVTALVCILLIRFAIRLLTGALSLISGFFNGILGILVLLAMIAIVLWMFSFVSKHR